MCVLFFFFFFILSQSQSQFQSAAITNLRLSNLLAVPSELPRKVSIEATFFRAAARLFRKNCLGFSSRMQFNPIHFFFFFRNIIPYTPTNYESADFQDKSMRC